MIDDYSFGRVVIDNKEYTSDIIIYPDGRVQDSWWRKSGHSLCIDDIVDLIDSEPQLIIAGTGSPGLMKPEKELERVLVQKGIEFRAVPSNEAMKIYNKLYSEKKVGACFHLTC